MKKLGITLALILLITLGILGIQPIKGQTQGTVTINSDGSVTPLTSPIHQVGNVYTLTTNISATIQVQKSNIVLDGAGYTVSGNDKTGIALINDLTNNPTAISNITIENLYIVNCTEGIYVNGGGNDHFYNDYIANSSETGIIMVVSSNNIISYCTIKPSNGGVAIEMVLESNNNTITENNLSNGVNVFTSNYANFEKNYWSDYLTKYPNATEIDSTGIGNQPYVYSIVETRIPLIYQDNHPLMKPVTIPLMGSNSLDTSTATPTVPELPNGTDKTEPFPTLPVLTVSVAVALAVAAGLLVYHKRKAKPVSQETMTKTFFRQEKNRWVEESS